SPDHSSSLAARQLVAVARIRRRDVEVERAQHPASGIADLVLVAALDEQQRPGAQSIALLVDRGHAATRLDEEPLVGAAMAVARVALALAGRDDHLRRLRVAIAQRDAKGRSLPAASAATAEAKLPALHLTRPSRTPRGV